MSAVVILGDFKRKGTVMLLRELLGRAIRGQVAGIAFNVEFKDGTRKTGFTGVFQADHTRALRVASRLGKQVDVTQDEDEDEPPGVVQLFRK